jgi:hypothetical protein
VVLLTILIIGCARIIDTYDHFNPVIDEPAHIVTGMEYLDLHSFNLEPMHPPLSRAVGALGLYLYGYRIPPDYQNTACDTPFIEEYFHIKQTVKSGYFDFACLHKGWHSVLWQNGQLHLNLALARSGILLFFIGACLFTWLLAQHLFASRVVAAGATALFSLLPPVLGNAGLVLTDMPIVMMLPALTYCGLRWLEERRWRWVPALAICLALTLLSKFSSLMLVPLLLIVLLTYYRFTTPSEKRLALITWRSAAQVITAALTGTLLLWAAFFFDTGKPRDSLPPVAAAYDQLPESLQQLADSTILPMPKLFEGIFAAHLKNEKKHSGYVLGKTHATGIWYFFPVAFGVKTPLAFLLAFFAGAFLLIRRSVVQRRLSWHSLPLTLTIVWLSAFMLIDVNAGLRHALFLYPFMSMIAAYLLLQLWEKHRLISGALAAGVLIASVMAHPRYMAWFNLIGMQNPSYFLMASDLDYGQDIPAIADYLAEHQIDQLQLCFFGGEHTLPHYLRRRDPELAARLKLTYNTCTKPESGYFAVNYLNLISVRPQDLEWLKAYEPVAKAGDTVLIYDFN